MADTGVPVIFNQQLLHKRIIRAVRNHGYEDFLIRRIAEDITSRLTLTNREFAVCALFGDHFGILAPALADVPNVHDLVLLNNINPADAPLIHPHIIGSEEQLPLAPHSINLAVLPLALQHVNDLPGALIQLKRALKPDGLLIAAILGGDTLMELRDALLSAEMAITGGAVPRIHPRVDIRDLGTLLQRAGFALPVVDSDKITVTYRSAIHLMHDLRALGLTNVLCEGAGLRLNRHIVAKLEEIYRERYPAPNGRINATFEIIYLTGWSPHESQQKPLKPGSAKMRLADVLKTQEISFSDDGSD